MSRPIRYYERKRPYFITQRCFQGRLLMRPNKQVVSVIGGIVARATDKYPDVHLHDAVFLSNHFHLILSADQPRLIPLFVGWVTKEISVRVGKLVNWPGSFFERRYDAAPILDKTSLNQRIAYMRSHGIKEGLVKKASQWPGITLIPELHNFSKRTFAFEYKSTGERLNLPIRTHPFPYWGNISSAKHRAKLMIISKESEIEARKAWGNQYYLGVKKICKTHPHSKPSVTIKSARIVCFTKCAKVYSAYQREYELFVICLRESYDSLLQAWREIGREDYFLPGFQACFFADSR